MRQRVIAVTGAVLAGAVGNAAWEAPAAADEKGFSVRVSAPDTFTVDRSARTVTAVVTSENRRCRKVRWALLIRSALADDQFRVTRVEDDGEFPATRSTEGGITTFLDDRPDPGLLCRGRTVTGRWQLSFTGPDSGAVQLEARAFDAQDTLLTTAGAATQVRGGEKPAPSASPEPVEEEAPAAPEEAADAAPPAGDDSSDAGDPALASSDTTLLGPGLIVGGVFVLLGVFLLLRVRLRARVARQQAQVRPTGFYTMPRPPR